ncbi:hypothetical protein [Amycolatopsis sp.]|uniref:hypothetical protein n=1 Tax=Amycolatopsis sp. TaxID=37632 RepID=UPI002E00A2FE|nr:hypothetical protein [Amycolatopsis sp.]
MSLRTTFEAARCYDGDVLVENLELFRNQRTRQAYDSLAQPVRLCGELLLLPSAVTAVARRSTRALAAAALIVVATAEVGRRRGGTAVYPLDSAWWAPLWLAERALRGWLALGARFFHGGIRYRDHRLRTAAHAESWLREHGAPGRENSLPPFP